MEPYAHPTDLSQETCQRLQELFLYQTNASLHVFTREANNSTTFSFECCTKREKEVLAWSNLLFHIQIEHAGMVINVKEADLHRSEAVLKNQIVNNSGFALFQRRDQVLPNDFRNRCF